jgi:hypothetical protein
MDFFYTRFMKGLQIDQLSFKELESTKKLVAPLSKQYHPPVIFCSYLPKVASTYLFAVIQELTGFVYRNISWGYDQNEQNIIFNTAINYVHESYVSKLMCKATQANLEIIEIMAFKPLIITRPITDIIISLNDHFENESYLWPHIYLNKEFLKYSQTKRLDIIIDHFTPWTIDYLNSWIDAKKRLTNLLWITYDDITKDLENTLILIQDYYQIKFNLSKLKSIQEKVRTKKNRFNIGVTDRGKSILTQDQHDRLASFFKHHPHLKQYI